MILILLILTYSSLANSKFEGFIVGGKEVGIERWAFITFISGTYDGKSLACGGSLLSSQTVLTAAHCLDDFTHKKKFFKELMYTVFMGHASYEKSTMLRHVIDYETHSLYDPHDDFVTADIGIMFLDSPVVFITNVRKTILVKSNFHPSRDKFFLVAGWGQTDPNANITQFPLRLKEARLTSVSAKQCEKSVYETHMVRVVCAGPSKNYPYSGDSGGPVVRGKDRYQLGIVSYRDETTRVTVFTSIPDYYKWINNTQYNMFKKHCSETTDRLKT